MNATTCELCPEPAEFIDSVPDRSHDDYGRHGQFPYREQPLCWVHASNRRHVHLSRIRKIGDESGHIYRENEPFPDSEFLNQ